MTTLEQEILTKVSQLDERQQRRVLDFISALAIPSPKSYYTAQELLLLPTEERERLIAESFAAATDEDFEIFEANSEDDFDDYVERSVSYPRLNFRL